MISLGFEDRHRLGDLVLAIGIDVLLAVLFLGLLVASIYAIVSRSYALAVLYTIGFHVAGMFGEYAAIVIWTIPVIWLPFRAYLEAFAIHNSC